MYRYHLDFEDVEMDPADLKLTYEEMLLSSTVPFLIKLVTNAKKGIFSSEACAYCGCAT
jgi:hypothetical protein